MPPPVIQSLEEGTGIRVVSLKTPRSNEGAIRNDQKRPINTLPVRPAMITQGMAWIELSELVPGIIVSQNRGEGVIDH
jgi:hypothetical protein